MFSSWSEMSHSLRYLLPATLLLLFSITAQAALISRTITIDGNMNDWRTPEDITNNPGQFSEDCEATEPCELDDVQSTGRDLKKFSYTWDNNYLYFYVERWASSTNTTEWLFYLDKNANGLMEANEPIFRVDWQGSNRRTTASLCPYFPANAGGDPLVDPDTGEGDGYTMPGSSANNQCQELYSNVVAGSNSGVEMESRVAWTDLGLSGPQNIRFHISSARGMNLPSQIEDNMDGPGGGGGGGGLFPPDVGIAITASETSVNAYAQVIFDIVLTHFYFDDFVDIEVDVNLPAQFDYDVHNAPAGTAFVDTNADGTPDQWQIPLLQEDDELTLQITVTAGQVPFIVNPEVTATISNWDADLGADDSDPDNNEDSVSVEIRPAPELSITKYANNTTINPGGVVRHTILVNNTGSEDAHNIQVTDRLSRFTSLGVDTFTGQPFDFDPDTSTLTMETPEYSDDGGNTWDHVLAPNGFDTEVTHFRIPFDGVMPGGTSFSLEYDVRVD